MMSARIIPSSEGSHLLFVVVELMPGPGEWAMIRRVAARYPTLRVSDADNEGEYIRIAGDLTHTGVLEIIQRWLPTRMSEVAEEIDAALARFDGGES